MFDFPLTMKKQVRCTCEYTQLFSTTRQYLNRYSVRLIKNMFAGGLGLSAIPLSGWRSKHRPREIDAFDDLGPRKPVETQNRSRAIIRLSQSIYSNVMNPRAIMPKANTNTNRQHVRSRRRNKYQQSPWDPSTNQSDQQSLISDNRHES